MNALIAANPQFVRPSPARFPVQMIMPNQILDNFALCEISESMKGLRGASAKQMAVRLAEKHGCTWQHVYKITETVRPARKTRADKNKFAFNLIEGTDAWRAAQYVLIDRLDPALALLTAKQRIEQENRQPALPSLKTFREMLKRYGLNKTKRQSDARPHRRFQSDLPGLIFQCDVTGLKERWLNVTSRAILKIPETEINPNHPNTNPNLMPVWTLMLIDDFSRRRFCRYVAAVKVTSDHVVEFLLEAYKTLCVPHQLYTDNGAEFQGRHATAARILNKILEDAGGYAHVRHAAHNAQATGKVEVAHQWSEKMNRLIGMAQREGRAITLELLNVFADAICVDYNEVNVHRETGQTPLERWHSKRASLRRLSPDVLSAAFLARHFTVKLNHDMTLKIPQFGRFQVPGIRPFVGFAGQKCDVYFPPEVDFFVLVLPDHADANKRSAFEIEKIVFAPDVAGDFKTVAETPAQQIVKRMRDTRKEEVAAIKAARQTTGQIAPIPFIDSQPKIAKSTNVRRFPEKVREIQPAEVAAVVPVNVAAANKIGFYEAFGKFIDEQILTNAPADRAFLQTLFADNPTVDEKTLREAIKARASALEPKRAAHLRLAK